MSKVITAVEHDVSADFFMAPLSFSLTIGSVDTALDLMGAVPPQTRFEIYGGGKPMFLGETKSPRR